jgi:Kp4
MRSFIPASLFILAVLSSPASALGINCRGSVACIGVAPNPPVSRNLSGFIEGIDQERWYQNGEQIACEMRNVAIDVGFQTRYFCAFLQDTGGAFGSDILRLAHYIPDHGCTACGSALISIHRTTTSSMGIDLQSCVDSPMRQSRALLVDGMVLKR